MLLWAYLLELSTHGNSTLQEWHNIVLDIVQGTQWSRFSSVHYLNTTLEKSTTSHSMIPLPSSFLIHCLSLSV